MRVASLLLSLLMALAVIATLPSPFSPARRAAATDVTIVSEGFEGAFPSAAWTVGDNDTRSGLDYWGVSTHNAFSGTHSVWCAQVGDQGGIPNETLWTYDNESDAGMVLHTPVLTGFSTVTLSFEEGGFWTNWNDYFEVWTAPSPTGPFALFFFVNGAAGTWDLRNGTVPLDTRYIVFEFLSESNGGGNSVGAYVDDVLLVGSTPSVDAVPPTIAHTPVTAAAANQSIPIAATITDNVAVTEASLYYEGVGASAFAKVPTTLGTPNHYSAQIPAQPVGTVHYYLEASDGQNTVTSPAGGAASPYTVDVAADTAAPTIVHTPPASVDTGASIPIAATITDDTFVASATVYYKGVGQSTFAALPMSNAGSVYSATIPAQTVAGTLQYYIEATDAASNVARSPTGGAGSPYSVAVQAPGGASAPLALIGGVVVLVVGLLLTAFLVMRRRRAKAPSAGFSPSSATPSVSSQPGDSALAGPILTAPTPAPPTAALPTPAPPGVGAAPTQPAASPPGLCSACGLQNDVNSVFCNRCGTRLR